MKKLSLSIALCTALSFAVVSTMPTPVEAQTKKSSKSSKTKVTVSKSASSGGSSNLVSVNAVQSCTNTFGVVGAVVCGFVFAPVTIVEAFLIPRA